MKVNGDSSKTNLALFVCFLIILYGLSFKVISRISRGSKKSKDGNKIGINNINNHRMFEGFIFCSIESKALIDDGNGGLEDVETPISFEIAHKAINESGNRIVFNVKVSIDEDGRNNKFSNQTHITIKITEEGKANLTKTIKLIYINSSYFTFNFNFKNNLHCIQIVSLSHGISFICHKTIEQLVGLIKVIRLFMFADGFNDDQILFELKQAIITDKLTSYNLGVFDTFHYELINSKFTEDILNKITLKQCTLTSESLIIDSKKISITNALKSYYQSTKKNLFAVETIDAKQIAKLFVEVEFNPSDELPKCFVFVNNVMCFTNEEKRIFAREILINAVLVNHFIGTNKVFVEKKIRENKERVLERVFMLIHPKSLPKPVSIDNLSQFIDMCQYNKYVKQNDENKQSTSLSSQAQSKIKLFEIGWSFNDLSYLTSLSSNLTSKLTFLPLLESIN